MKQKGKMKQNEKKQKNKLNVTIFNEQYVIKGEADQAYIEKVASYVDNKMEQIAEMNEMLSAKQIAVLVALNLADEYLQLRHDYDELIKLLNEGHTMRK
ncbi:MAG: cell division protein ZapA [Peptococcia bacterium]|jgi:cell division protein ZapA